ncbi:hypothetical protein AB0C27_40520 [Nonomuraea sp. NPDC048882]|uniref:hypothetical protein n=1 Tax=Nonomuraea sp. NPDC048882 TaxID=3154347 RepID=UPI0033D8FA81
MTDKPVITVTPTIMDGTVVRWHRSLSAAECHAPTVTASRHGVMVPNGYVTEVPPEWLQAAMGAYETLRRNRDADMKHLATHRHNIVANGPLVPVEEADRG